MQTQSVINDSLKSVTTSQGDDAESIHRNQKRQTRDQTCRTYQTFRTSRRSNKYNSTTNNMSRGNFLTLTLLILTTTLVVLAQEPHLQASSPTTLANISSAPSITTTPQPSSSLSSSPSPSTVPTITTTMSITTTVASNSIASSATPIQESPPTLASNITQEAAPVLPPILSDNIKDIINKTVRPVLGEQAASSLDFFLVDKVAETIDLSHPLDDHTLHWPANKGFQYGNDAEGEMKNEQNISYYYKSDSFSMAIHTGTHLDAPRHFDKDSWTVEQIPLERMINVPVQVIDLSEQVKANRSYNFSKKDFINQATGESLIRNNSIVLVYTGISNLYDMGPEAYFGTATKNYNEMKIPGFSGEAAQFMVDSGVFGVGLDAPSADSSDRHSGTATIDPVAHATLNRNNVFILENINKNLAQLVGKAANFRVTVLPLPIRGASGSPVRLVAQIQDNCLSSALTHNSAYALTNQLSIYASLIMALVSYIPVNYFH